MFFNLDAASKIRYTVFMSRTHSQLSQSIVAKIGDGVRTSELFSMFESSHPRKAVYDCLFRLKQQGVVSYDKNQSDPIVCLTEDGTWLLSRVRPKRDGVWKIVIFDIPEKKREVRNHLRSKLKTLGFKKWQESIWVSPYAIDPKIEDEFNQIADKLFIRLIKTTDINYTKDLEKLFA